MISALVGKSGPGMYSAILASVRFGLRIRAIVPFTTSRKLCGGISVAIPTAIPVVPFNRILGTRAGKLIGSFIEPSKLSCQSQVPCPSSDKSSSLYCDSLASV